MTKPLIITAEQLAQAEQNFSAEKEPQSMSAAVQAKPKRAAKAKVENESDDEVLARSLAFHGAFNLLNASGATDDEILVEIRQRWRQAMVFGKRLYHVEADHKTFETAIWVDVNKPDGTPRWIHGRGYVDPDRKLIDAVRRVIGIGQPADTRAGAVEAGSKKAPKIECHSCGTDIIEAIEAERKQQFSDLKKKGKSKPATVEGEKPPIIGETETRPIDWFTLSPYDTRAERSKETIDEIAASMAIDGQLNDVLVRETGEHLAGWTRKLAAKKLGWKELRCKIVKCTDAQARRIVLIENAKRKDLTEREKTVAYSNLLVDYKARGLTQRQLAKDVGISESTLSNNVRLQSLDAKLWERFEHGALSIDQIRKLSLWGDRELFAVGFLESINVTAGSDAVPGTIDFNDSCTAGLRKAFRRMTPDQYGGGCQFKPTPAQREELKIISVKFADGGEMDMAENIELWNKLNEEAIKKAKQKEKAKKGDSPKPAKGSTKQAAQAEELKEVARQQVFNVERDECWFNAFWKAIRGRFGKPKKADQALAIRLRMIIFAIAPKFDDWSEIEPRQVLSCGEKEFGEMCLQDVKEFFADNISEEREMFDWNELYDIITALDLNALPHFKPSLELLQACSDNQIIEIADGFGLATAPIGELRISVSSNIDTLNWKDNLPEFFRIDLDGAA